MRGIIMIALACSMRSFIGTASAQAPTDSLALEFLKAMGITCPEYNPGGPAGDLPWGYLLGVWRVNLQTLYEQENWTERGCDTEVPRLIDDNMTEFCGGQYACDNFWLDLDCLDEYECEQCNGPCLCVWLGRQFNLNELEEEYAVIELWSTDAVWARLEAVQQLTHQVYDVDVEFGTNVYGAYSLMFKVENEFPGSPYDWYHLSDDPVVLAQLETLDRSGLDTDSEEETFLRLLSGALAVSAAPGLPATEGDPYYVRALELVEWQRAYTNYARGWDWQTPMDRGFPDWYPSGADLQQLVQIVRTSCHLPYFDWSGCIPTSTEPTSWGTIKLMYR